MTASAPHPVVRPRGVVRPVPLVFVTLGVALLVGLGVWQLFRLASKEHKLAQIAALQTAPARPLAEVLRGLGAGGDADFLRVSTTCPTLERTPTQRLYALQERGAAQEPTMGWRLITACPVDAAPYRSVLVDRGFVARDAVDRVGPGADLGATPVVGVLRHGDKPTLFTPAHKPGSAEWFGRDLPAMAAALHAPAPAPLFLMLERPLPHGFGPTPSAVPTDIPNNHLGYALTWFGFAVGLVGVYVGSLLNPRQPALHTRRPRT